MAYNLTYWNDGIGLVTDRKGAHSRYWGVCKQGATWTVKINTKVLGRNTTKVFLLVGAKSTESKIASIAKELFEYRGKELPNKPFTITNGLGNSFTIDPITNNIHQFVA